MLRVSPARYIRLLGAVFVQLFFSLVTIASVAFGPCTVSSRIPATAIPTDARTSRLLLTGAEPHFMRHDLSEVLRRFGAKRMVMGHTTMKDGRIGMRFGGRTLFIDTGLSKGYGGHHAALEIRGDRLTAIYPEGRVELLTPGVKDTAPKPAQGKAAQGK